MNDSLVIPGLEHFVSDVKYQNDVLVVRLVADLHPGAPGAAYELTVTQPESIEITVHSLGKLKEQDEVVYARCSEDAVILETELSEQLVLRGATFAGEVAALNVQEITEARDRIYRWYLAEGEHRRKTQATLHRVSSILTEQAKRIRVKASSHPDTGTAGVLYSQQLSFIERLLRETKV